MDATISANRLDSSIQCTNKLLSLAALQTKHDSVCTIDVIESLWMSLSSWTQLKVCCHERESSEQHSTFSRIKNSKDVLCYLWIPHKNGFVKRAAPYGVLHESQTVDLCSVALETFDFPSALFWGIQKGEFLFLRSLAELALPWRPRCESLNRYMHTISCLCGPESGWSC